MEEIGDLREIRGELVIEWKIKDFLSLSNEQDIFYRSPIFYFSGTSWELWFYPNGETRHKSEGWISLYLMRMSCGSAVTLTYSLTLKSVEGNKNYKKIQETTSTFAKKGSGLGSSKVLLKSALMEMTSDELAVIVTLKNNQPNALTGSCFSRLKDVSDNLRNIYKEGKRSDILLKADGEDIQAHRVILETRSPVFCAMFKYDTKESKTGEVSIDDIDMSTLTSILTYMYSGDLDDLSTENVLSIFAAAEKYDIKDIKAICSEFIMRNLSVEWFYEVVKFAELYDEEEVRGHTREYFKGNARKILKTEKWKQFAKENQDIGFELLGSVVFALLPE